MLTVVMVIDYSAGKGYVVTTYLLNAYEGYDVVDIKYT